LSYNSPFSIIKEKDHRTFDFTHNQEIKQELHRYDGSLYQVIDSIQEQYGLIWNYDLELLPPEPILELLLMNGRILRAILDYKDVEKDMDYVEIVEKFIDMSFKLYNLDSNTLEILSCFVDRINDTILSQPVFQQDDSESWVAMDPYFSAKTMDKLRWELWWEDYVFITLWHGGIVPGIDVFLRLQEVSDGKWKLYPIRFSRIKHKDKTPQLSNKQEWDYVSDILQSKTLIIFDEDSSSGQTLQQAKKFFEDNFSGYKKILQVANLWKWDYQTDSFVI